VTADLSGWTARPLPLLSDARGRHVHIDAYDAARDRDALHAALGGPANEGLWTYLPDGPFAEPSDLGAMIEDRNGRGEWRTHTFRTPEGAVCGMASYMRLRPAHGSCEIGAIVFGDAIRRRVAATEAMYLMAAHVFEDLGYRRYEWKCNALNAASRRAAERLGFVWEGRFRQDMVVRGQSRDTDWYAMTDADWPSRRAALRAWLDLANFDASGRQLRRLEDFRQDGNG
jgi:RimJ/RimL family protein N-acetyltransferase